MPFRDCPVKGKLREALGFRVAFGCPLTAVQTEAQTRRRDTWILRLLLGRSLTALKLPSGCPWPLGGIGEVGDVACRYLPEIDAGYRAIGRVSASVALKEFAVNLSVPIEHSHAPYDGQVVPAQDVAALHAVEHQHLSRSLTDAGQRREQTAHLAVALRRQFVQL